MFDEELADKKHHGARELELLSIRTIMKTENGRNFMFRCLQNCSTFESIFNEDGRMHAFNEGRRSHGIWLDDELHGAAPDDYFKMLKENR